MKSESESYKNAGVDITAGYKSVELMKQHIARTITPGVMGDVGGFGGLFKPEIASMKEPVLVSGTDGVGAIGASAAYSLLRVVGPATPSAVRPAAVWNAITAP